MVLIAHASIDENKNIKGGKAGDQTGKEVCIREWYNKPWDYVIRFNDRKMADKVAEFMEQAVANDNVGYDQNQRNTLLSEARKVNWNVNKIKVKCETDCSALITVACIYAGIPESALVRSGNCATTRTLRQLLKLTGKVSVFSSIEYTQKTSRLVRGDILLKEGSHVVAVVRVEEGKKTVQEIAREVLAGKWGNGETRRTKLQQAGYNYDEVQKEVSKLLHGPLPETVINDTAKFIWNFLYSHINNAYGVAGLMGNLKAESNLNPKNMQNSYEKKLGMNDETYTKCVDNQSYKNFSTDKVGYGLAQWTSNGRKKALYEFRGNKSIGDLEMQLNFLWKELTASYKTVLKVLYTAKSVREASDIVLTKFERPKDQSESVKVKRANFGKEYYDRYNS